MDHNKISTSNIITKPILEMETVIAEDLVKPLVFFVKYLIPFHNTINFDPLTKRCAMVKGSPFRKLVCIMFQLLVLYRLGLKAIPSLHHHPSKNAEMSMDKLAKAAYLIFITFSCVGFYVYWFKADKVCKLLNHVIQLADKLHLEEKAPERTRYVKIVVHASWTFVSLYLLYTLVIYSIQMSTKFNKIEEEWNPLCKASQSKSSSESQLDFTEIHTSGMDNLIPLQIISAVASFSHICCWMLTFFHMAVWAMLFRQLIATFYSRFRTKEQLGQYLVMSNEIRTFNRIAWLIDQFNEIYGLWIFLGAIVIVAYVCPSIKYAFSELSDPLQPSSGLHLLLSYIPMITTTVILADTHRMAGKFANVIQTEFNRFNRNECGDLAECLCGITIIHYNLVTSNVGMKGLGFFTVSYQFISTIVSIIISYSILVMQMFPTQGNSNIEV